MADEASAEDLKISLEMEEKVEMDPDDNEDTEEEEEMDADEEEESSTDDSDDEELEKEKIRCLEEQIRSYPFNYQPHVELIELLRRAGELNRLRTARERMNEIFPLTEELWMEWLKDEISLAAETDRPKILKLFERAVRDYLSVDIWLEYAQYTIGGMGEPDGITVVRSVFDRAVSEVGLHLSKGSNVWDAYREFENAILAGLKPESSDGADSTYLEQKERLLSIFKRQLSVPLLDMKDTYTELKAWFPEEGSDKTIQQLYQQTLKKLEKLQPLEKELDSVVDEYMTKMEAYYKYIEYELSQDDPARIRCIYERAITFGCLDAELWLQYTRYLDTKLPIKKVVLSAYERSVRNCPWKAELWGRYILALERYKDTDEKVTEVYDKAINSGFTEPADFLHVYTVFCDYKRRRINWDEEHTEEVASFRTTIQRAIHSLKTFFGDYRGDPSTLQQYWASIEVKHCKNIEKARELWNSVMTQGHGAEGHMWMEYFQMEKAYGNTKNCRKVLQRALNSVTDWPQMIVDAYLRFEREEGSLDDYEVALNKCTAQLQRLQQRKALAEEKAQMQKDQRRQSQNSKKTSGRSHTTNENSPIQKETSVAIKRKMDDKQVNVRDKDGFRIPVVPALVGDSSGRHHETDGPTSAKKARIDGPPPGFTLKAKPEKVKNENTVFVSNLNYDLEENHLEAIFSKCGEISEIRLIQNFKGKSKGYAYVEFKSFDSVKKALALDRELAEGRPMFVSECEDRSVSKTHQFKFATSMEQNKLFIKGLPFTTSKDALETIFKEYGTLKDVRLVTYRNGAPKGLAYVEYADSGVAAKAVLQTDGLKIGDHTISVSISNPPSRKAPATQRSQDNSSSSSSSTPSLGSGKKETELRGKARTMVSLVPRALQRGKSSNSSNGSSLHSSKNGQNSDSLSSSSSTSSSSSSLSSSSSSTQRMSNDDFRQLLLKP